MKILVTGGLGFIGSNFIRHILKKYSYDIINLDRITYSGNPANLKDIEKNKKYKFFKGDICDSGIVETAMKGCDAVVNFAAETHVDRSVGNPESFISTNILGTYTLLESARKQKIKRFLHISTDEVYGSIETGSFNEDSRLNPSSPYSASKASADLLAMSYFATYIFPVIITRSSNNFGPYQYPEKLTPLFITNILEGKKVPIYGKGINVRDWLYVIDNCEAIDAVLHKGKIGEIYNIASKNELSNIELTKKLFEIIGKGEEMTKDKVEYVKDRPGHDLRYSVDTSKISKLGWKPQNKFYKDLSNTVEWYKNNELWWKPLKSKHFRFYEGHYEKHYEK